MTLHDLLNLSFFWPVLLGTGVVLGTVTMRAVGKPARVFWFIPVFLIAAAIFAMQGFHATPHSRFAPVELAIAVIAVSPSFAVSTAAAKLVLKLRSPRWVLAVVPTASCLLSAPLVGIVGLEAACRLTGDCL